MSLPNFIAKSSLLEKTELEKTRLLAFYHLKLSAQNEFTIKDVTIWFQTLNLAKPNPSRLKMSLAKSSYFVRGTTHDAFRLHAREIAHLDSLFPAITRSEEVVSHDTILPTSLYKVNRSYVEALAKQINASYENNIFDGCAVLMRRLLEILLIHAYENLGIESIIKDSDGNYLLLEKIVKDATSNATLSLSRNTKTCIDKFRTLGNFSAHKIYYICKPSYIEEVIPEYRATIEELLYKSGLKI